MQYISVCPETKLKKVFCASLPFHINGRRMKTKQNEKQTNPQQTPQNPN